MNDFIDHETLMIRFLQGAATPAEEEHLRSWRDADPANERRFRELQDLWLLTGLGAGVAEVEPPVADVLERATRAAEPRGAPERTPVGGRDHVRRWRVRRGALAAGLAAVAFGVAYVGLARLAESPDTVARTVETGVDERVTVMLLDGSSVRLGPNSRLEIHERPGEERVELNGRAFFAAESTPTRSLVVETAIGQVMTLGTRFEVRAENDAFRVLVVDGRVAVSVEEQGVEVGRGEMSRAAEGAPLAKSRVADVYGELDWMGNHLAFKATPLERVAQEIQERFGARIVIEDAELREFPVTATFTDQPVTAVVHVLCELVQATCASAPNGVRIGT